jgi:hypothetical protein
VSLIRRKPVKRMAVSVKEDATRLPLPLSPKDVNIREHAIMTCHNISERIAFPAGNVIWITR